MHASPVRIKRIFSGCCWDDVLHKSLLDDAGELHRKHWDGKLLPRRSNNGKRKTMRTHRVGR